MEITREEVLTLLKRMEENKTSKVHLDIDDRGWIDFDIFDDKGHFVTTAISIEEK